MAYSFPTSDGSNGQVLKTDGSGALTFQNESGGSGATLSIFKYTITSNTTVFTGNDDDNQSLLYDMGGEQVFLNGVKLVDGGDDYTHKFNNYHIGRNAISGDVLEIVTVSVLI